MIPRYEYVPKPVCDRWSYGLWSIAMLLPLCPFQVYSNHGMSDPNALLKNRIMGSVGNTPMCALDFN